MITIAGDTAVVRPTCGYPRGLLIGLTKYSLPISYIPDLPIRKCYRPKMGGAMRNVRHPNHKSSRAGLSLTKIHFMRKHNTAKLDRRSFLAATIVAALPGKIFADESSKIYTAAIIGHTGHGDYGHSVDQIFTNREDVQVLAVADPVAEG